MLVVLSPAKTLDYKSIIPKFACAVPAFLNDSQELVECLALKKPEELSKLMNISNKIAILNFQRFQDFKVPFTADNARPCIFAFKGDVYQELDLCNYTKEDLAFAQKHLRILSGLYGLLKPLDLIQPYRLEMGTALENPRGKNLYDFWGDKITKALNSAMSELKTGQLVNLASNEYSKVIKPEKLKGKFLNIVFKEKQGKEYNIIGIFAKRARGKMSNYIIKNRVSTANDIMNFAVDGYKFNGRLSDPQNYVFTRNKP